MSSVHVFTLVYYIIWCWSFLVQLKWLDNYYATFRRLMGPELDRQGLHEEKAWMLKHTEPFLESGSSASVCSSSMTLIALAIALLQNIIWASPSLLHSIHSRLAHWRYSYAVPTEQLNHVDGCTADLAFFKLKDIFVNDLMGEIL